MSDQGEEHELDEVGEMSKNKALLGPEEITNVHIKNAKTLHLMCLKVLEYPACKKLLFRTCYS